MVDWTGSFGIVIDANSNMGPDKREQRNTLKSRYLVRTTTAAAVAIEHVFVRLTLSALCKHGTSIEFRFGTANNNSCAYVRRCETFGDSKRTSPR